MRKLTSAILLFGLIFVSESTLAQQKKAFWDGYEWERITGQEGEFIRLGYLIGLGDGQKSTNYLLAGSLADKYSMTFIKMLELNESFLKSNDCYIPCMASYGQLIEGINEIYKDYANKHIPVFALVSLVCKRTAGEIDLLGIEKELERLRAKFREL
jgi:hypothetical protein